MRWLAPLLLFWCPVALAWGSTGHEQVAQLAWEELSPRARAAVREVLSHHPDPDCRTLFEASQWPDTVRDPIHPFHHLHRPGWHFVNQWILRDGKVRPETTGELLSALEASLEALSGPDTSKVDRALALSWLVHLVGDLHQPLHCVSLTSDCFPEGDRGGADFPVFLGLRVTNLHALWDRGAGAFPDDWSPRELARQRGDLPRFPGDDTHPTDWGRESLLLARSAYEGAQPGQSLTEDYLHSAQEISKRQVSLAGSRLAAILETLARRGYHEG